MGGCNWRKRQRKRKHFFCCAWHILGMFSYRDGYFFSMKVRSQKFLNMNSKVKNEKVFIMVTCLFCCCYIPLCWVEDSAEEWICCYLPKQLAFRSKIAENWTNFYYRNCLSWKHLLVFFFAIACDKVICHGGNCSWTRGKPLLITEQ